jgi:hypothetical protein
MSSMLDYLSAYFVPAVETVSENKNTKHIERKKLQSG